MNEEKYRELMLKHAQIQTSMLNIVLFSCIMRTVEFGTNEDRIGMIEAYKAHCDTVDDETCKALGTTKSC
jgi:hypothetical protein